MRRALAPSLLYHLRPRLSLYICIMHCVRRGDAGIWQRAALERSANSINEIFSVMSVAGYCFPAEQYGEVVIIRGRKFVNSCLNEILCFFISWRGDFNAGNSSCSNEQYADLRFL